MNYKSRDLDQLQNDAVAQRKAALERFRAAIQHPAVEKRQAERLAINEARRQREAEREAAKKAREAEQAKQAARAAERAAQAERDAEKAAAVVEAEKAEQAAAL